MMGAAPTIAPDLAGKVAVITGSSRGIGRAVATAFAASDVSVVINGRDVATLDTARADLERAGRRVRAVAGSVAAEDDVRRLFDVALGEFGRLDVLVNCAGGGHGARDLHRLATGDLEAVIRVDLVGTLLCCREAVQRLTRPGGCIINVASQAGRSSSELAGPHYAAAKAGVIGLTRQLARDYGPVGIRVNVIAPGITLVDRVIAKLDLRTAEERAGLLEAIPLRRFAEPEEIASVAVFLASDAARYITGATIDVNGGRFTL
jgi:3-oxoacyl-[acyl-carrier protein] reductase